MVVIRLSTSLSASVLAWSLPATALLAIACGGPTATPTAPTPAAQTSPAAPTPPQPPAPAPLPAPAPVPAREWDINTKGIPRFVSRQYLDLSAIARISRFRSGVGHSYTDDFESCRSMKHYFQPKSGRDWGTIPIWAPTDGEVVRVLTEWAGDQIHIESSQYPAFRIILFHVRPTIPIDVGTRLTAGQTIGTHIGSQTMSDVAVGVSAPGGYQLVSWFDVLDEGALAPYFARGLSGPASAAIERGERDARPLSCAGESFTSPGELENWVHLN